MLNAYISLSISVVPKITPFSFQDDPLLEGAFAHLSCVVYQGDLPITFQWLKDDQPISEDLPIKIRDIDDYSSILTIDKVSRKHSGKYTCVVRNEAAATQHSAQLVVNGKSRNVRWTGWQCVSICVYLCRRSKCRTGHQLDWLFEVSPLKPSTQLSLLFSLYWTFFFLRSPSTLSKKKTPSTRIYICVGEHFVK